MERELTESWKDKRYEPNLTDFYFEVSRKIMNVSVIPNLINLRIAFSAVERFINDLIYKGAYFKTYEEHMRPTMNEIKCILYGNPNDVNTLKMMAKYGVLIDFDRFGRPIVFNAQNILDQLNQTLFLAKQIAYAEGLFLVKPFSKVVGIEAIEHAFTQ